MEPLVSSKVAHFKFHGVPWNCSYQRNWRTLSSMEFHGIPWNCSCRRHWRTPSSMEFHGTARVIEIGALLVPRNSCYSMELLMSVKLAQLKFLGIPWNSMELLMSTKLAHSKFHGIPRNYLCQRNLHTPSSKEFHGISWSSIEPLVSGKLTQFKFHGIPMNCLCQRNWRTPRSMEFQVIPWNCWCHQNWHTPSSMGFHRTARVIEIGALLVPWNSMEPLMSSKLAHSSFHGIP